MKKIYMFTALLIALLTFVFVSEKITLARVTSSASDRDVWCEGVSGSEVCLDSSGNFIPTTDDNADLGKSALQWQDGYFDGTVYTDAISNEGAYTGTSGSFTGTLTTSGAFVIPSMSSTTIAASTPTVVGQLVYNSTRFAICVGTSTLGAGYYIFQSSNPITLTGVSCKE